MYWAEADIKNRFLGNTLEIIPNGLFHVLFHNNNEHFYWNRVRTSANNLIIGTVWVDNYGDMTITNSKTGETCTLTFKPKGWWGKGYGEVEGYIYDAQKVPQYKIFGNWNEKLQYVPAGREADKDARPVTLWKRHAPVAGAERYYNYSAFAFELNEITPDIEKKVCENFGRWKGDAGKLTCWPGSSRFQEQTPASVQTSVRSKTVI